MNHFRGLIVSISQLKLVNKFNNLNIVLNVYVT